MYDQKPRETGPKRFPLDKLLQGIFALAGIGTFFLLVSKVDFRNLADAQLSALPGLILAVLSVATVTFLFDTLAWWILFDRHRPGFWSLVTIRLRAEAFTNALPGGALIGEPMKIVLLRRSTALTRAEATTPYLLSRFAMIVGQVFYIVTGVALSYDAMNRGDMRVGSARFSTAVLAVAIGILLLFTALLAALVWFKPLVRWLNPSQGDGRWHRRWNVIVAELHSIEELIARSARNNGLRLFLALLLSFAAWSLNGVELFLILNWFGLGSSIGQGYALDAVSSITRMVLFVLPSGIGAQDWTVTGLMAAFGFAHPVASSANIVVMKRAREFIAIVIGLVLLRTMRRSGVSEAKQEVEEEGEREFPLTGERHLSAGRKEA
jgi:uncharacterized protein (TIRG00374 family)